MNSTQIKYSKYQENIFDWIVNGRGDAVVEAVAGSGKTFTLVEAAKLLRSHRATFVAFNVHIIRELEKRLGKAMSVKTVHSIGCSTIRYHLGKTLIDDGNDEGKYVSIIKPYAQDIASDLKRSYAGELRRWHRSKNKDEDSEPEEPPSAGAVLSQLKKLVHFCRVTLTPPDKLDLLEEMVQRFSCLDDGLELKQLQYPLIEILREGEREAQRQCLIDFDDMLWLPWKWNLTPYRVDHVFIDECQDLSPAQLDLVLKMRSPGGRMLFCGDSRQAIFGFAGASSDSMEQILKRTNATVLPLSICYRCPKSHVELAKAIVPQIEAREDAPLGDIEYIPYARVSEIIREGDLVISRCTAPVVKLCIELIAKRIPARVKGRDIGRALTVIVEEVAKHPEFEFRKFGYFLQAYQQEKIAKLQQKKNAEAQIESLRDRCSGIWVSWQAFDCKSVDALVAEIEVLFSDERASVQLSTVHRAKGLEEKRVFILRPDQLPLTWKNQQDWEKVQENNLKYVALTRAKESLFIVTKEKPVEIDKDLVKDVEDDETGDVCSIPTMVLF